jgi:hypothetical protein
MTQRRLWYFCKQIFTPRGWSGGNELLCYRMAENDPRAAAWLKRQDLFFAELPPTDPISEVAWLTSKHRFLRFSKLTVKDAPADSAASEELK